MGGLWRWFARLQDLCAGAGGGGEVWLALNQRPMGASPAPTGQAQTFLNNATDGYGMEKSASVFLFKGILGPRRHPRGLTGNTGRKSLSRGEEKT